MAGAPPVYQETPGEDAAGAEADDGREQKGLHTSVDERKGGQGGTRPEHLPPAPRMATATERPDPVGCSEQKVTRETTWSGPARGCWCAFTSTGGAAKIMAPTWPARPCRLRCSAAGIHWSNFGAFGSPSEVCVDLNDFDETPRAFEGT